MVQKHHLVSNASLAKRREMGHSLDVNMARRCYQDREEGCKRIEHQEKTLVSED
jgi:hypothetical protein